MNQTELIDKVADNLSITRKMAKSVISNTFATIIDAFHDGKNVRIAGLGTFRVVTRKARKGHNPQNGEIIQIPEKQKVVFKPARNLKNLRNRAGCVAMSCPTHN